MRNFDYYLPEGTEAALEVLRKVKDARPKAGGTDLLTLLKGGIDRPKAIVNLLGAKELGRIEAAAGGKLVLGATATLAQVAGHEEIRRRAPAVAEAAERAATPLLRNRATIGGNLCQRPRCWYFRHPDYHCSKKGGDLCYAAEGENKYHAIFDNTTCNIVHPSNLAPALWAHDAILTVHGAEGGREVPIADFWVRPEEDISTEIILEPGELVTQVSLTGAAAGSGSAYVEVREKQSYDWALVCSAGRVDLDGDTVKDARIVISAVAPVPLRREEAEAVLKGQRFSEELAWKAGSAAADGATPLRDNAYKVLMLRACVAHTLIEAARRARGQ